MNKRTIAVVLAALVCILLLANPTPAMDSANYAINWDMMGGSGGPIRSTNYALDATLGQPSIGFGSNPSHDLCSGYWCGAVTANTVYLPLVLRDFSP